jgi:DNA-binding beta-propeller fold protein YncE
MLFLGGTFKTVGGKRRRGLAAVDTTRGHVLPWRLHGDPLFVSRGGKRSDPGTVDTLALSRDARTLFLSGSFNRIGGKERAWVGAIRVETGRATGWNPAPNGLVGIVEPAQRGRAVYIAGDFTHVGGARRNELAAVDDRTGKSLAFNAHVSNYASITDLVATPTTVYVAGDFTSLGGRSRHLLASLDARTGAVTAWEPSVTGDEVDALAVDAGRNTVYLAGRLSEVGGERRDALAAVDARTGAVTPWDPRALGDPKVLLRGAGGIVFAGGRIAFVGGVRRHGLASITAAGSVTDWDPPLDGTVRSLALSPDNSRLYVGGAFAPGDAPAQRNLAVVDRSTGTLHAFGGGTNSGVWAIAPSADGSVLYIGGAFVTVAGKRRVRLAALDASTGTLLAWNSGANDLVRVLLPAGDALYAGGDFASAGGLPRARLVKLDASTGSALGWNPEADDNVWALALRDQTLFVGGEFGHIGGKSRNRLAALDVESGAASSWDPNADDIVRVLGLSGDSGRLFVGGAFEKIGASRRGYAEFSLPDGSLTGWSPVEAFDSYALASVAASSSLVIGGEGGADVFR